MRERYGSFNGPRDHPANAGIVVSASTQQKAVMAVESRGMLRICLGAASGVGKTYPMLDEGLRRMARGTDVVVGFVETRERVKTASELGDLPVVARKQMPGRARRVEEVDVGAILARRPALVLVDELAHTNAVGSRSERRWQDVDELLDAGIDVISTLNIQHLGGLSDVVQRIGGRT